MEKRFVSTHHPSPMMMMMMMMMCWLLLIQPWPNTCREQSGVQIDFSIKKFKVAFPQL
jgi:hypothetical protein